MLNVNTWDIKDNSLHHSFYSCNKARWVSLDSSNDNIDDSNQKLYYLTSHTVANWPYKYIIEALPQHARKVLVVDGVEQLRLVQVTAEGVSYAGVSQSTEGAVKLQSVVMELP